MKDKKTEGGESPSEREDFPIYDNDKGPHGERLPGEKLFDWIGKNHRIVGSLLIAVVILFLWKAHEMEIETERRQATANPATAEKQAALNYLLRERERERQERERREKSGTVESYRSDSKRLQGVGNAAARLVRAFGAPCPYPVERTRELFFTISIVCGGYKYEIKGHQLGLLSEVRICEERCE